MYEFVYTIRTTDFYSLVTTKEEVMLTRIGAFLKLLFLRLDDNVLSPRFKFNKKASR